MKQIDTLMNQGQNLVILYVEDDQNIREEMSEILEDIFSEIILAKNGEEGLEKFESYKKERGAYPDIVITDITMPKSSGIEMSKKILAQNSEQSIIVISAHNETVHLLELINMGIEYYLLKPIKSKQFLETLQRAIKKIQYKKMEVWYLKELEKLAYKDPLTNIANRRLFFKKAATLFDLKNSKSSCRYFFIFDIDNFKNVNDTFGHDMGDEVLKMFVKCVQKEIRENDCFARLGGDEFVMILQDKADKPMSVLRRIQDNINQSHVILGQKIDFTVSVGLTKISEDDENIDVIIKRADIDLYRNKSAKK